MITKRLGSKDTGEAAEIIRRGGLLGIPTETVYGLGANALNADAVAAVFLAKGRPQDNPLIIHVPDASWIPLYCREIPPTAYLLAERFWPGPLTMILKRNPIVPDVVTAGLDTVGIRCPDHTLTRDIIRAAGVPIAAPSGNTSGRPSPTSAADMLEDMDGKIDAVADGGPCRVGVESTIIDLTVSPPCLLRPGGVTLESLREILGKVSVDPALTRLLGKGEKPKAPGMKYRHYAPKAPVTIVSGSPEKTAAYIRRAETPGSGILCFDEFANTFQSPYVETFGSYRRPEEQAQRIFAALRNFDRLPVVQIWAQVPSEGGIGLAVNNRLNKAAGFKRIETEAEA